MNPYEHLSKAERIARIGQLLSKGVTLMLMAEAAEKRGAERRDSSPSGVVTDGEPTEECLNGELANDGERDIVNYLSRVRSASPRDMQQALNGSKATIFRRLRDLSQKGIVVRIGHTKAVRYRLTGASAKHHRNNV
jgi:uncharacterized membrane protein